MMKTIHQSTSELHISSSIEDNSKVIFLSSLEIICCDSSSEPSRKTVLMMGHKICFYGEIWLIIPKLLMLPLPIWSSATYFVYQWCKVCGYISMFFTMFK